MSAYYTRFQGYYEIKRGSSNSIYLCDIAGHANASRSLAVGSVLVVGVNESQVLVRPRVTLYDVVRYAGPQPTAPSLAPPIAYNLSVPQYWLNVRP